MPKKRTKRNEVREERKRKRQEQEQEEELQAHEAAQPDKKRRIEPTASANADDQEHEDERENVETIYNGGGTSHKDRSEVEYFGILDEQETEAFHHIDRNLRENELTSTADVEGHVEMAFNYAEGKELKLACSQGFSRFLERLVLLSTTDQKKSLMKKFAGHYMTLLQHRFASHICETLFMQCAPLVSDELARGFEGVEAVDGEEGEESMETLFLATMDEMEGHMDFLLTDRFGSHTLRVLLLIMSGRPLLEDSSRAVIHSKAKEHVTKEMVVQQEWMKASRKVPESFVLATKKIIRDSTANMDTTALKVMAKHPIGNPALQFLLDLDISFAKDTKNKGEEEEEEEPSLLSLILPDSPKSLSDPESTATDFIMTLIFDQLGSRLLEVIVAKCPGRIFKPLFNVILKPRMEMFIKNETAAYSVMKALGRLNKSDLEHSVKIIEPLIPTLLQRHRYNVLTTLFERCDARACTAEIERLTAKLSDMFGWGYDKILPNLFLLNQEVDKKSREAEKQNPDQLVPVKPRTAILPHAANLANAMLSIDGKSRKAIQSSLSKLTPAALLSFVTESAPTASVVVKALQSPPPTDARAANKKKAGNNKPASSSVVAPTTASFHKLLVANLVPHVLPLSLSPHGHNVLIAIAGVPPAYGLPFHLKQNIISILAAHEEELRASKQGRRVWYSWNGVLFTRNQALWSKEMKQDKNTNKAILERGDENNNNNNNNKTGVNKGGRDQDQHDSKSSKTTTIPRAGRQEENEGGDGEDSAKTKTRVVTGDDGAEPRKTRNMAGKKIRPIDIAMLRGGPKTASDEENDRNRRGKGNRRTKRRRKSDGNTNDDGGGKGKGEIPENENEERLVHKEQEQVQVHEHEQEQREENVEDGGVSLLLTETKSVLKNNDDNKETREERKERRQIKKQLKEGENASVKTEESREERRERRRKEKKKKREEQEHKTQVEEEVIEG